MKYLRKINIEISPLFVLLLCLWFYADPWGLFWPFLLAAILHELGHCAACSLAGAPVTSARFGGSGAVLRTAPMSYRAECLCALAGPAVNLLLCTLLLRIWPAVALVSFLLAVFNLLPLPPLDGGRALRCLLLMTLPEAQAEKKLRFCRVLFWAATAAVAAWWSFGLRIGAWPVLLWSLLLLQGEGEIFVAKRRGIA